MGSFLSAKAFVHEFEFEGEKKKINFYPISVRKLSSLRGMAGSIAQALTGLFGESDIIKPKGRFKQKIFKQEGIEVGEENEHEPPLQEAVDKATAHREAKITQLIDVLLHESNMTTVAGLLINSMRDEYTPSNTTPQTIEEFIDKTDVIYLIELLHGFVKAHREVFRPLEKMLGRDLVQTFTSKLKKSNTAPETASTTRPSNDGSPTQQDPAADGGA